MKITIETIPHFDHRYPTAGDYWGSFEDGSEQTIVVSDMSDRRMSFLVALHELIESFLCEERGISEEAITAFDVSVSDDSPFASDPGHDPEAPYHREHVFAECIERMVAQELGLNWQEYDAAIEGLE